MALKARAERPSLLIVADCDYPGWGAKVDGRAVPVERVHGSFRAVVVPAGTHRVELSYAPSSVPLGSRRDARRAADAARLALPAGAAARMGTDRAARLGRPRARFGSTLREAVTDRPP